MPKPAASDVQVTFLGKIPVLVDLLPLTESKAKTKPSFKMICPACDEPTPPEQWYKCIGDGDHGLFKTGDLDRAVEVSKGDLRRVAAEEIEAVKEAELPPKMLTLSPYPAEQVDAATRPAGPAYRLKADKNLGILSMLTDLVADASVAFVGELNLGRSGQHPFRAAVWNGQLIVQQLARPDEVLPCEPVEAEYPEALLDKTRTLTSALIEEFDPEAFRNTMKERAEQLVAAKADDPSAPAQITPAGGPKVSAEDELMALLEDSLAVVEAKKQPAKKAARAKKSA